MVNLNAYSLISCSYIGHLGEECSIKFMFDSARTFLKLVQEP